MAKQTGDYRITGTYDDVTYYKMDGQYYARKKSGLKGSRVKRDPAFKRTMEWARRLAAGSQLASKVYRSLPRPEQVYALFCRLKSTAIGALKEGKQNAEVLALLRCYLAKERKAAAPPRAKDQSKVAVRTVPDFIQSLFRVWGNRNGNLWRPARRPLRLMRVPRE